MIESELCPGCGAVAVGALSAVTSSMNIVLAVTIIAAQANVGEVLTTMTALAANGGMRTRERKFRLVMIKRRVCPGFGVVARTAIVS